jgi:Right handed beta helix region
VGSRRRGWLFPAGCVVLFAGLGALPLLYQGYTTPPWVQSARRIAPVPLTPAAASIPSVQLSAIARPVNLDQPPASQPVADSSHMAALVAAEDVRLRTLQHHTSRLTVPVVVPVRGALPTLVLPGRPAPYTITDLQNAGAVVPLKQGGGYLLVDSVLVATNANLKLGGAGLPTLLMDSSAAGFTSLVTWGGTLTLAGDSAQAPLTITGWDRVANQPAADHGYGRPYIRSVGGKLELRFVHASSLGFWSGRTGGVAWTGVSSRFATGGATSSTFVGNTYGAFVSRGDHVAFNDDLFEGNQLDGLRLHRGAVSSTVTASAAARNGGNGFVVSRGATGESLHGDLAVNNQGNGFLLDGQPLVNGASPSGSQAVATLGTDVEASEAESNARTGILVNGGASTVVKGNIVCGPVTGIAVRAGATNTSVIGNDVRCGGRTALSIGPSVTGTTVVGNRLESARIGMLVRNSPGVRIMDNRISDMSLFGISVRGASPGVVGNDNLIAGQGFNPIDTRGGATTPTITNSNLGGWHRRSSLTPIGYLRYHPILATWVVILMLVAISMLIVRFRRRPVRPYTHTVPWHSSSAPPATAPAPAAPAPGYATRPPSTRPPTRAPQPAYAARPSAPQPPPGYVPRQPAPQAQAGYEPQPGYANGHSVNGNGHPAPTHPRVEPAPLPPGPRRAPASQPAPGYEPRPDQPPPPPLPPPGYAPRRVWTEPAVQRGEP